MRPRWHKVLGDLVEHKTRGVLIVLCIAVGVLAVGLMASARQLLSANLNASYRAAQPATATLTLQPFDDTLIQAMRRMPGVRAAEGRTVYNVRLQMSGGAWRDLLLFARDDSLLMNVNRLLPEQGASKPPLNQLVLERSSAMILGAHVGETAQIELSNGKRYTLRIGGIIHDLNQASSLLTSLLYAFVTPATLDTFDLPRQWNQLLLRTDKEGDRRAIQAVVQRVVADLKLRGYIVSSTTITDTPGELWLADPVRSMLLLLATMGALSLLSSAILVATTMSALLQQQLREVGVMKAIGANTRTLLMMYLSTVLIYSVLALAIAIPLAALGAYLLVVYATKVLNIQEIEFAWVPEAIALQLILGLSVPLLAALVPVLGGSRVTVREAINSYGSEGAPFGVSRVDQFIVHARALPRPLLLSLRNAFRRKGRLALTLSTLILSGTVFITVLSVRESLLATLDEIEHYRGFDVQLTLDAPYRADRLARIASTIPDVSRVEGWGGQNAQLKAVTDAVGESVLIVAVPADSTILTPTLFAGRWLSPADQHAIVVNSEVTALMPALHIGDTVTLDVNGDKSSWNVVGIARGIQRGPIAYVNYDGWARARSQDGLVTSLQVITRTHDTATQARVARALESAFKADKLYVSSVAPTFEAKAADQSNMDSIIGFLSAMAILLAVVGTLGLMGALGISVLERTRELGVLRAIGAPTPAILQMVIAEGVLIALLSWLPAILLAIPLSRWLADQVGAQLVKTPLTFTFSFGGLLFWLALLVVIATLASALPAWNAARIPVRDALAYE